MLITKTRIRDITPYFRHLKENEPCVLGVRLREEFIPILKRIGFPENYSVGDTVLPASVGSVSTYNAEGKEVVRKDLPMETVYRQGEWTWTEWHGRYQVEQSKIVDIPYDRYPRDFLPPPSVEFTINKASEGSLLVTAPSIKKSDANKDLLTHMVNLFLEIFRECEVFTADLDSIAKSPVVRLNWEILPKGDLPWEQFKKQVEPIVKKAPEGNQPVLYYRLETIDKLHPDFRAVGRGGFHGYVVHGFTERNLFVLESLYYGNATYVFDEKWEVLSKMTKAEILNDKLQKARLIHREGWEENVGELINSK